MINRAITENNMTKITKEIVLNNLEEIKKFIAELEEIKKFIAEAEQEKKEEKKVGIAIKNRFTGLIIFQSTKTTFKEAVVESLASSTNLIDADLSGANLSGANLRYANLRDANLRDANLRDANLRNANLRNADFSGAELNCAKFYGRGGTKELTKAQLPAFLGALGFVIVD